MFPQYASESESEPESVSDDMSSQLAKAPELNDTTIGGGYHSTMTLCGSGVMFKSENRDEDIAQLVGEEQPSARR